MSSNGSTHVANGRVDQMTSGPLKRGAFRAMIQDFSPLWFTWCMNSGIIGILIRLHPYRFTGINTLACIFFGFDFLFFCLFSVAFVLRICWFPKQTWRETSSDIGQLALTACWPIAWLTLTNLVALLVNTAHWGQYWATMAAYVMWWISFVWIITTLMLAFIVVSRKAMLGGGSNEGIASLPPLIIIPAVGVSTQALTGGAIVTYGVGATAKLAVPVIIASFVIVGIGLLMGSILLAMLWYGLFTHGYPAPAQTSSLFVFIGPVGQSAAAFLALGTAASSTNFFAQYNEGTFISASAASVLPAICTVTALPLLGVATFFFFFGLQAMIERLWLKQLSWNITWNSIIFPTGTMTTTITLLSTEMNSPAFAVFAAIQLIFLVILFLFNLVMTILKIVQGELLIVKEDPRVKKELEDMNKEK